MNRMCARTVATAARSSTPASRISPHVPPPVTSDSRFAANDAPRPRSALADQRDLPIATLEERLVCHEAAVSHHLFALREHVHDAELMLVEHEQITVRTDLEPAFLVEL